MTKRTLEDRHGNPVSVEFTASWDRAIHITQRTEHGDSGFTPCGARLLADAIVSVADEVDPPPRAPQPKEPLPEGWAWDYLNSGSGWLPCHTWSDMNTQNAGEAWSMEAHGKMGPHCDSSRVMLDGGSAVDRQRALDAEVSVLEVKLAEAEAERARCPEGWTVERHESDMPTGPSEWWITKDPSGEDFGEGSGVRSHAVAQAWLGWSRAHGEAKCAPLVERIGQVKAFLPAPDVLEDYGADELRRFLRNAHEAAHRDRVTSEFARLTFDGIRGALEDGETLEFVEIGFAFEVWARHPSAQPQMICQLTRAELQMPRYMAIPKLKKSLAEWRKGRPSK